MKAIIIALLLATSYSYSLDTLWTHSRGLHGAFIDKAEFSPDESIIVLASDHGIKAVSTETGETIWNNKLSRITGMTKISIKNELLITGYFDNFTIRNTFRINVLTGEMVKLFDGDYISLAPYLSRDGELFAIRTFKENEPNTEIDDINLKQVFNSDKEVILESSFDNYSSVPIITPDNKYLLLYGGFNGVKKYSIETGELEHHFNPVDTLFDYVEISKDGRYMVASNKKTSVYIYNLETNEVLAEFNDKGELFNIYFKDDLCLTTHVLSAEKSESYFRLVPDNKKLALLTKFPEDAGIPFSLSDNFILAMGYEKFFLSTLNWTISDINYDINNDFTINPNPSSEFITINYLIDNPSNIILTINDVTGNQIEIIDEGLKTPNNYEINYNLNQIPSGTYFITLQINESVLTKQFIKE